MNELLTFVAQNTVLALAFALLVLGLAQVVRNPPLMHLLWLLVLLKLVLPPVMRIEWSTPWLGDWTSGSERSVAGAPPAPHETNKPVSSTIDAQLRTKESVDEFDAEPVELNEAHVSASATTDVMLEKNPTIAVGRQFSIRPATVLCWSWLGGAALCALAAATRIVRFERRLRDTLPASERLQRLVLETATTLGVRHPPDVRCAESIEAPSLWCFIRRATIVLPMRLLRQLDDRQIAMILAHELAHLRRRDHWVRVVELIVSIVLWWNPLAWLIRRQIHQAEELCCDAWVRWAFPDGRKRYAEVVFKAAESLSASQVSPGLLPVSPFLRSLSLKARIEMILESQFKPRVSARSMCLVALLAALVVPSFVLISKSAALAAPDAEVPTTPSDKAEARSPSEFPHAVKFEQGATKFSDGDKITILEVRGTADTFAQGNIYHVKGTYTLASRDRAVLLASVTQTGLFPNMNMLDLAARADYVFLGKETREVPGQATGAELKVQRKVVERGSGTFTLFLPISALSQNGLPHVSFYSFADGKGGKGFGGNYFGTGDSVLKHWWGAKEANATKNADKSIMQKSAVATLQAIRQARARTGNERIQCELIGYKVADARFYPLVGPARLSQARFKCMVISQERTEVDYLALSDLIPVQ